MKKHDFKGIRKLSAIVTLALVLTIGGVYATFSYATGTVQEFQADAAMELAGVTTSTAKGTISVTNPKIKVDDAGYLATKDSGTVQWNYKIALDPVETKITVSFTPASTGISEDIKNNGIKLKMKIVIDDTKNTYTDLAKAAHTVFVTKGLDSNGEVVLNNNAPIKAAVTVDITEYIGVADLSLPTKEEYDNFQTNFIKNASKAGVISITISEYVEPTTGA